MLKLPHQVSPDDQKCRLRLEVFITHYARRDLTQVSNSTTAAAYKDFPKKYQMPFKKKMKAHYLVSVKASLVAA